jgi:hypothetical protein
MTIAYLLFLAVPATRLPADTDFKEPVGFLGGGLWHPHCFAHGTLSYSA